MERCLATFEHKPLLETRMDLSVFALRFNHPGTAFVSGGCDG